MGFFSKAFNKSKDTAAKKQAKENGAPRADPPKPRWDDAWQRTSIEPEEVQELLRGCTVEIKSRGLDLPFLLLPFRPASDPSAARTFVRNFFGNGLQKNVQLTGERLTQELRLVEPLVLCSVVKWCWSRLPGGVVGWDVYELFVIGEQDSASARDSFATFIPLTVGSEARTKIIFDFFELMAAIAAHGKMNGLGGRKLSRYAAWWAFDHKDTGNGFEGGYKEWMRAADAASHLFFAYLRSSSPDSVHGINGISALPRSLLALLESTEYPPVPQAQLQSKTSKVVMIVETVSPTPFALLRRAKNFQYREDDRILQRFSDYEDPVDALTEECRRVLKCISSANDLSTSKASTSLKDPSWSRFEDVGFGGIGEESDGEDLLEGSSLGARKRQQQKQQQFQGLRTTPASKNDGGRPTTPSWADFLSSGFVDDSKYSSSTTFLPPDKQLPPITMRGQSSQSHRRGHDDDSLLEPGELANINVFNLDDTFWWVWITSLAGEEPAARKAAFGRCALIETRITGSAWIVMEEIIKGAAPEPEVGAYVAEKKSRFGFSKRSKLSRSKSSAKGTLHNPDNLGRNKVPASSNKPTIAPDQHARIQAAAAALQQRHRQEEKAATRRARQDEDAQTKTTSVLTLQPVIMKEAAPAMKWASSYDKNTIRAKYLGDNFAGRGSATDLLDGGLTPKKEESKSSPAPAPTQNVQNGKPPVPAKEEPVHVNGDRLPLTPGEQGVQTPLKEKNKNLASLPPLPDTPANEQTENAVMNSKEAPPEIPDKQPTSSTPDYPRPMERKAVPPLQQSEATPKAVEPPVVAQSTQQTPPKVNGEAVASPPSPESPKQSQNKLKKKNAPSSGFKGMFGRKKVEEKPAKPQYSSASSSSAVAAAKAALEAKASQAQSSPPQPQSKVTNKRFSTMGNKGPIEEPTRQPPTAPAAPAAFTEPAPPAPPAAPTMAPPAAPSGPPRDEFATPSNYAPAPQQSQPPPPIAFNDITVGDNRTESPDLQHTATEGKNYAFNQGPMQDVPAFVPEDSPRNTSMPEETYFQQPQELQRTQLNQGHSVSSGQYENDRASDVKPQTPARDDVSEVSEGEENTSPATDRWAQIRKNAAERAAKMNAEQAANNNKEEENEESGEETIESRVARIKARVAELTGNMDTQGTRA